jgi:hypothetical protein
MTICNICAEDKVTSKYDELDLCLVCRDRVNKEVANPRVCKPDY